jgi:opacity protein-like surface antigen
MKRLMAIGAAAALSSGAMAQNAVQWRVEDGGNGHWYFYQAQLMTWTSARASAEAVGGDLASLESAAEWSWARSRFSFSFALVGARQDQGAKGTAIGWRWLSGDAVTQFTLGMDDNPCGAADPDVEDGQQDFGEMVNDVLGDINTVSSSTCSDAGARPSLVEWSADCNSDGIVDYGQIRTGELADANTNNIPDCCENTTPCGCVGDTNLDASVDGIDLATVLTRWAQPAAKFPEADCNRDGVIDGADLAIVLGSWGACP